MVFLVLVRDVIFCNHSLSGSLLGVEVVSRVHSVCWSFCVDLKMKRNHGSCDSPRREQSSEAELDIVVESVTSYYG